ncbi:XRE family transcriptional regulator [Eubacterium sp. AF17-7]|uniref:helix-turn-helix domain-containing protein n=1 Tax=Eubacterium sp. AF17-7 TaxID=2293105 RepID=UPI000E501F61|nr:helix-turn-helix transcriptional regulator [Eubacterium sp. AF17-7]RGG63453.1 XRE family transcriptional regulator [Eubacterium sp. AF17-7]
MNERLKQLRKFLGMTQQKFADKLGVKRNTVGQWECGINALTDQVITSICREWNVSEDWLRDGKGDMFLPVDRNTDLARLTKQLLDEESDSFKNRFISMLSNLTVEEWEFLERKARELCGLSDDDDKKAGED